MAAASLSYQARPTEKQSRQSILGSTSQKDHYKAGKALERACSGSQVLGWGSRLHWAWSDYCLPRNRSRCLLTTGLRCCSTDLGHNLLADKLLQSSYNPRIRNPLWSYCCKLMEWIGSNGKRRTWSGFALWEIRWLLESPPIWGCCEFWFRPSFAALWWGSGGSGWRPNFCRKKNKIIILNDWLIDQVVMTYMSLRLSQSEKASSWISSIWLWDRSLQRQKELRIKIARMRGLISSSYKVWRPVRPLNVSFSKCVRLLWLRSKSWSITRSEKGFGFEPKEVILFQDKSLQNKENMSNNKSFSKILVVNLQNPQVGASGQVWNSVQMVAFQLPKRKRPFKWLSSPPST